MQYRSFCVFAVTSVTLWFIKPYIIEFYLLFLVYFNIFFLKPVWKQRETRFFLPDFSPDSIEFPPIFPAFSLDYPPFFICCVTLVTAKKQHCGWNARLRVRACNSLKPLSLLIVWFCNIRVTFYGILKKNSALFRDFFTLWRYISPYTNRRCCKTCFAPPHHSFLLSRRKPI